MCRENKVYSPRWYIDLTSLLQPVSHLPACCRREAEKRLGLCTGLVKATAYIEALVLADSMHQTQQCLMLVVHLLAKQHCPARSKLFCPAQTLDSKALMQSKAGSDHAIQGL